MKIAQLLCAAAVAACALTAGCVAGGDHPNSAGMILHNGTAPEGSVQLPAENTAAPTPAPAIETVTVLNSTPAHSRHAGTYDSGVMDGQVFQQPGDNRLQWNQQAEPQTQDDNTLEQQIDSPKQIEEPRRVPSV